MYLVFKNIEQCVENCPNQRVLMERLDQFSIKEIAAFYQGLNEENRDKVGLSWDYIRDSVNKVQERKRNIDRDIDKKPFYLSRYLLPSFYKTKLGNTLTVLLYVAVTYLLYLLRRTK